MEQRRTIAHRKRGQAKTGARFLEVTIRRQFVFAMRRTGASYATIFEAAKRRFGEQLPPSYNRQGVFHDVTHELEKIRRNMAEDLEAVRTLEMDRLDRMIQAMWPRAIGAAADLERGIPAIPAEIGAQQMVLNCMQRRARYLPGLEAPVPIAPVTPDGQNSWQPGEVFTDQFCTEVAVTLAEYGQLLLPGVSNGAHGDPLAGPEDEYSA